MLSGRDNASCNVSHNIDSVKELCTHALWLDQGRVRSAGEVNEVCDEYEKLEKK